MYLSLSCINHKSIMYLLSRYLSCTYHQFVIYLSYIYYLSILYLLSSNHISIISLSYIFHLPLIYLSYIYHPSIIYLSSIYHKSIIYLSYIYCRRGRCKEQRRMPPQSSWTTSSILWTRRHVGHRQERSASALTIPQVSGNYIYSYTRESGCGRGAQHILFNIYNNITYSIFRTTTNKKETCGER